MKALYDSQAFTMQKFGGVSKCFCELIAHLPQNVQWEIGIKECNNVHLHDTIMPHLPYPQHIDFERFICRKSFPGKGRLFAAANKYIPYFHSTEGINQRYTIELLKRGDFDVFHPTFFDDYYLPYLKGKPFVLTIHDMTPELFPQYFKKNNSQIVLKRKLAVKASAVIAVSESTKKDIIGILGIPEEKVTVIYHGGPESKQVEEPPVVDFPYFLFVGGRGGYKNFSALLDGFALFHRQRTDVRLVCTGHPFSQSETERIQSLHLADCITQIKASDKTLANLYAHAMAFIYPSLYEGFGMPILEAYAYGCPVILNKRSCFPEIAGDAAIYFDTNEDGVPIAESLTFAANLSSEQRQQLIALQKKQLHKYSWQRSSLQLSQLYASL